VPRAGGWPLIAARLALIQQRIRQAALDAGRDPAAVRLVAVSKTVAPELIRRAAGLGVTTIGESYVQEARAKQPQLADLPLSWHFIGHLQTNKARFALALCDLIHSVDSLRLAEEIDRQAARLGKRQAVLLQVNSGGEASKTGVAPGQALPLARAMARLPHLSLEGLMTLPPYFDDPQRARPFFNALRRLRDELRDALPQLPLPELSMGMSGDFEAAIAEGATLVRIGTAIFGERV
jgi:hypothetical protein